MKDDFFTVSSVQKENNSFKIVLELNAIHKIFQGHFPGHPVMPGVLQVEAMAQVASVLLFKIAESSSRIGYLDRKSVV